MRITRRNKLRFFYQLGSTDCGAACLAMVSSYYGRRYSLPQVKTLFSFTRVGVTVQDIMDAAKKLGLTPYGLKLKVEDLREVPLPLILYWKQDHFIVLERVTTRKGKTIYHLADPGYGRVVMDEENFINAWKKNNEKGVAIVLQEAEDFEGVTFAPTREGNLLHSQFFKETVAFFKIHKTKYVIATILIVLGLAGNWLIPFIFQRMIDIGIEGKALNVVFYLLAAQFVLFISSFLSDFFSNVILTKINFNLTIRLRKSLLYKLMRLPVSYFDTRLNTETLQRIGDQNTVQDFITWKGISFALSVLNIIVFSSILFYLNLYVFILYIVLSALSILWVLFFLKRRAIIEYATFIHQSENNNDVYEFIMNMPEIKVNDAQTHIINKIIRVIDKINSLQLRSLFLNLYQNLGVNFLSQFKELIAVGICAVLIVRGNMTLGTLLSVSYVIGQLVGPVQRLVDFIREAQDANIATKRIGEIYNETDEDNAGKRHVNASDMDGIHINKVSFKYPGSYNPLVLQDVSFDIPKDKVTAIVGASGSGKTTLLKLLLSYYKTTSSDIFLGNQNIGEVYSNEWRRQCGIVLQGGKIFSGTLASNIVFSDDETDWHRVDEAARMACLDTFIASLPLGYHTKVGNAGIQLSGGQEQRILIARAIYKDPQFLFLDEATSALDAENERRIYDNLQAFFSGRTVLVIAHRLSTVRNADQIVVLKNGRLVEKGNHEELVSRKGDYFNLVRNQLELGS